MTQSRKVTTPGAHPLTANLKQKLRLRNPLPQQRLRRLNRSQT